MLDVFSHFTPAPLLARYRELAPELPALTAFGRLPELWDVEARLESLADFPDVAQVLNMGNPPVEALGDRAVARDLARQANEELAALSRSQPERFPAFTATLPMGDVGDALAELDHAVGTLGARGVQLYSNVAGTPLSHPRFRPIFARLHEEDLPVLIHPYRGAGVADYATEDRSEAEVWFTFGWPYESSACAARLVFSGIFDELPGLKVVLHHMGAMIPFFADRIALGFEQIFAGVGAGNPVAERAGVKGDVVDHFRHFYADTAVNGSSAAVRCGMDFFGPQHCLLGTDAPFSPDGGRSFLRGALGAVDDLGLPPARRDAVLAGNARRLFRLDEVAA